MIKLIINCLLTPYNKGRGWAKTWLIMRLTFIMIIVATFAVNASGFSQKVTIDVHQIPLEKVLNSIGQQTGYGFLWEKNAMKDVPKVSLKLHDVNIHDALKLSLKGLDMVYEIHGKVVYIKTKPKVNTPEHQDSISAVITIQQQISGLVIDTTGAPIIGATVQVKGTKRGVLTDNNGRFQILADKGDILKFGFVGFKDKEVMVSDEGFLRVSLRPQPTALDDLIVVGYGTQKRNNVTSAISTLQAKEINTTTNASLAQSLTGKIPGLQIRQQNSEPGAFSSSINIRGFGEPLYVIDGIVRDGSVEFQQLNPSDIESISILKDASAAIYGLNAANGVIMVTTKKGLAGKPIFNYSGVVGFQKPTYRTEMSNATQYLQMYDQAIYLRDGTHSISQEELAKWQAGGPGYESTDWYNATFKSRAMQQQHDFSIRGGSDKVKYFLSLGHYNEAGLFKSNDMDYTRYTFRSNITAQLSNNLTADLMLSGRYNVRKYPGGDGFIWMYKATIVSHPNESPYINNNLQYPANIFGQQNAVIMSQDKYAGYTNNKDKAFQSSVSLTYKAPFLPGLQVKGTVAYDSYNSFNKNVWKSYRIYSADLSSQLYNQPRIANSFDDADRLVAQGQLDYNTTIANSHHIGATLVNEYRRYSKKQASLQREYDFYTTDIVDFASGTQTNGGSEDEQATLSYVGRFNYDYQNKYLIEYAFRYDGSYRYAPGKRWGFFPNVSAGWVLSRERFIKKALPFVSNLKLRGSYGLIGENVGAPFQHVLGFTPVTSEGAEFTNGSYTGGLAAPGVINPNFTWVKSKITDFGIDLGLFGEKLTITADYYQRDKTGKLKVRNGGIPNTFGGDMPIENLESDQTRGFDFIIGHQNKIGDFTYGVSVNMNLARTKYIVVDRAPATSSYNKWTTGLTDRWNDIEWGYTQTGQFQNFDEIHNAPVYGGNLGNSQLLPGDYTYQDVNGDGIIDNKDLLPIFRNRDPKMFYGMVVNAGFKHFDFNMVWQGAALYTMRFNEVFSQMFFNDGNVPAFFYDRWHQADPYDPNSPWIAGTWPASRFAQNMQSDYRESSIWRMNAAFARLKSIEVGFLIPEGKIKFLKSARVYINMHNPITISKKFLKQFDPERYEGDYLAGYNYPVMKSYNLGVNVSF
jgi:TonB-linked SusC/RagA family outer membrane protein